MEQLPAIGTSIETIVQPTMQIYTKLLQANASRINSASKNRETHRYGPHQRQNLDIYMPTKASNTSPILLWAYGGGLVAGDKNLPIPGDLVYSNVGHFFTSHGFITIVMNYRLVYAHDAQFPSGGEDIALAMEWIAKHFEGQKRDLFGLGNSAGGIHWSTFLFHDAFVSTLAKVTTGDGVRLRGVTLQSVPFEFTKASPSRDQVLKTYYEEEIVARCPYGLMTSADDSIWAVLARASVQFNVTTFSLDPEDEILIPVRRFVTAWNETRSRSGVHELSITKFEGHNHISPFLALGTGIDKEEAWGNELVKWMEGVRKA